MENPDFSNMRLEFAERLGTDNAAFRVELGTDEAGDLRTVLSAFARFLQAAGFVYVTGLFAELNDGRVSYASAAGHDLNPDAI